MKIRKLQDLLKKYDAGTASEAERYIVDEWYETFDQPPVVPGLQDEHSKRAIRARIWQHHPQRRIHTPWYLHPLLKVAASMIVVVSVGLLCYQSQIGQSLLSWKNDTQQHGAPRQITTGVRNLKRILLPDSSAVYLNANSVLEISPAYNKDNRAIQLTGEAFFEVKSDTSRPFIVNTQRLSIRVLGTSFNIQSYEDLEQIKVAVRTGSVAVRHDTTASLAKLTANEELTYHKNEGKFQIGQASLTHVMAWREGRLIYHQSSFKDVVRGFQNLYGIKLNTQDPEVASHLYTLTLKPTMNKTEAISLMCTILNKKYKEEEDGTIAIY
ncbi:FecR family protein [Parapedobacter deserti]|uniref:FecR family protein n=1 Tax=Parapedobacter deserti TaxID=1912957 RepID=A0ABV7JNS0_9SPHI